MKIQKFNENTINSNKNYYYCIISIDNTPEHEGLFETETDMNNWMLNIFNEELSQSSETKEDKDSGIYEFQDNGLIFINVYDAISWYTEEYEQANVDYGSIEMYKNVTLKYGVEELRDIKNFNL